MGWEKNTLLITPEQLLYGYVMVVRLSRPTANIFLLFIFLVLMVFVLSPNVSSHLEKIITVIKIQNKFFILYSVTHTHYQIFSRKINFTIFVLYFYLAVVEQKFFQKITSLCTKFFLYYIIFFILVTVSRGNFLCQNLRIE